MGKSLSGAVKAWARAARWVGVLCAVVLSSCSPPGNVPANAASDHAPTLKLNATPVVSDITGDVEPDKGTVSADATVKVTRGAAIILVTSAANPGGVMFLTVSGSKAGQQLFHATTSAVKDASGKAPTSLAILGTNGSPQQVLQATIDAPVTVVVTATNFNNMPSTITVTYVPADLEARLGVTPNVIGYNNAPSATLSWSALYGTPPYGIKLTPDIGVTPISSVGSASVSPSTQTTYVFTVKDQHTSMSATALLNVTAPPPAPKITSFVAAPDGGYAPPGHTDTISWTVANCTLPDCNVTLTGAGTGYASTEHTSLAHLATTGHITYTPNDTTNFQLNASSQYGKSSQATVQLVLDISGGPNTHSVKQMAYYFTILDNNPSPTWACALISVTSDTQAHAQTAALAQYGGGFTIGHSITEGQFLAGQGC